MAFKVLKLNKHFWMIWAEQRAQEVERGAAQATEKTAARRRVAAEGVAAFGYLGLAEGAAALAPTAGLLERCAAELAQRQRQSWLWDSQAAQLRPGRSTWRTRSSGLSRAARGEVSGVGRVVDGKCAARDSGG